MTTPVKQTVQNAQPILNKKTVNNEEPVPIIDPAAHAPENPKDSYEGRKNEPDIKGPIQKSQETDEIYADPRKDENLPDGGKNVGELNAYDLSLKGNQI